VELATRISEWSKLLDSSLAVVIAMTGAYLMFRLFERTERERRTQVGELIKLIVESLNARLLALEGKIDNLRGK
jgi:NO-binding membrane sensor protein with MHYT domain